MASTHEREYRLGCSSFLKTAVPNFVPRKHEIAEPHEMVEILPHVFSISYVFSTSYGSAAENESYLRSHSFNGLRSLRSVLSPCPKASEPLAARGSHPSVTGDVVAETPGIWGVAWLEAKEVAFDFERNEFFWRE